MEKQLNLLTLFEEYVLSIRKKKSQSTYNNTIRVFKKLKEIENQFSKPIMVPVQNGNSIAELKKHELFWKRFEKHLKAYCYKKNYLDSYIQLIFKIIQAFLNWLKNVKHLKITGFASLFKVKLKLIPIITLDETKWNEILQIETTHVLSKKEVRTKDLFVFGCITGLRYSDLSSLKRSNLEIQNSNTIYLTTNSKKTQTYTRLKLPSHAIQIIKKYKGKSSQLLPFPSLNQFNKNLKSLGEKIGWIYEVGKPRFKNEKTIDVKTKTGKRFRYCDLLSSHIMRRTAITNMLFNGMPEHLVRKISGHSATSSEFFRYVNYYQSFLDNETDTVFDKILKAKIND